MAVAGVRDVAALSAGAKRLAGHLNAAEYWLNQADIYEFPNPARTECLQLASIHAALAQALSATSASQP